MIQTLNRTSECRTFISLFLHQHVGYICIIAANRKCNLFLQTVLTSIIWLCNLTVLKLLWEFCTSYTLALCTCNGTPTTQCSACAPYGIAICFSLASDKSKEGIWSCIQACGTWFKLITILNPSPLFRSEWSPIHSCTWQYTLALW